MFAAVRRITPALVLSSVVYAQVPPGEFRCGFSLPNTAGPIPWAEPRPLLGETRILIIFHNFNPALQAGEPYPPIPEFVDGRSLSDPYGAPFTIHNRDDAYNRVFDNRYPGPFAHETVNDWFREVSKDRFRITGDFVAYCTLDLAVYPRPNPFVDSDGDGTYDDQEWYNAVERGSIECAQQRGFNVDLLHVQDSDDAPWGLEVVGDYDRVVFVGTWYQSPGGYALPFDFVELDGHFSLPVLIHELGHLFRFYHANGWDCGAYTVHPPPGAPECLLVHGYSPDAPISEYWDPCSVMGDLGQAGHFGARHKFGLGWFDADQEVTAVASGIYHLTPLETAAGPKLIRIPRPVEGGYYDVDFRQPIGFDQVAERATRQRYSDIHVAFRGVNIYNDTAPHESNMLDMTPATYMLQIDFKDGSFETSRPFVGTLNNVCAYVAPLQGSGASP